MGKNIILGFFLALVLLIISEYFLLNELFLRKRLWVLALTTAGLLISVLLLRTSYKRFRKTSG